MDPPLVELLLKETKKTDEKDERKPNQLVKITKVKRRI